MSNLLTVLAGEITEAHQRIRASTEQMAEQALDLGRKLIAAKAELPHGSWAGWLEANTSMSSRSAQRYMRLAASGVESATVAHFGLRAAEESLAREKKIETDLDNSEGWPMPPRDGEVLIGDENGSMALIWSADGQPTDGPRFYDFLGVSQGTNQPAFYNKRGLRAHSVANTLKNEKFVVSRCTWDIRDKVETPDIRAWLETWRREDREYEFAKAKAPQA